MTGPHVLVARLDNAGDVLLAGPAVRAVARRAGRVTMLVGPAGTAAAGLLPGVDHTITWTAPWVPLEAPPVLSHDVHALVARLTAARIDEALVLTSFHQSPLPLALLLRLAGVGRIAATSVDHAGSLLDERLPYRPELHEVEQSLAVAAALGHRLPDGDHGELRVRPAAPGSLPHLTTLPERYVVVHPGASVPARALPPALARGVVAGLAAAGHRVVVTGGDDDRSLVAEVVAGGRAVDLAGTTSLASLAELLRGADALVVGNTGPAHLAAAVGTPVVSVFAPVVDPRRWAPWRVPHRLLGHLAIDCAGCRSRTCPFEGQPCTAEITVDQAVAAVEALVPAERPREVAPS